MRQMRVLLTGSSGYVGAVTRTVLSEAGHEVVGLDTALYEGCDLGVAPPPPELRIDVRDVQEKHLEGFDAVVIQANRVQQARSGFDRSPRAVASTRLAGDGFRENGAQARQIDQTLHLTGVAERAGGNEDGRRDLERSELHPQITAGRRAHESVALSCH